MNNPEKFKIALESAYRDLKESGHEDYEWVFKKMTPEALAFKMLESLFNGSANKDGEGIKRACKAVGIKHTYAAIKEFLHS